MPPPLPWYFAFFCFVILGFGLDIKIPPWFEAIEVHHIDTLLQDQITLKGEIAEVKQVLTEEKALNAKRHEDLLSALLALTTKFPHPPSSA